MPVPPSALVRFFVCAFAVTYALQAPAVGAKLGLIEVPLQPLLPLAMLGIFGPTVAAMLVVRAESGWRGVRELFASLSPRHAKGGDALLALLLPAALLSGILLLFRLAGREGPIAYLPDVGRLVVGVVISIAEEIGWRGVAQPRLEKRYGAYGGAGIVGALWTLWHIPMMLGAGVPLQWLLVLLLLYTGGSLVFGWLLRRSGSLLVVVLAHLGAHLNNSQAALPADGLPLVVHAIVFGALGIAVTGLPRPFTRWGRPGSEVPRTRKDGDPKVRQNFRFRTE